MQRFLVQRLVAAVVLLWLAGTLTFLALHLAPGDIAMLYLDPRVPTEQLDRLRSLYGLDQSLSAQYVSWLKALAQGDFGVSPQHQRPVFDVLAEHLLPTVLLGVTALLLALFGGVSGGLFLAQAAERGRRGAHLWSLVDRIVGSLSAATYSIPTFWLGLMLLLLLASGTGWFPLSGMRADVTGSEPGTLWRLGDLLRHLALPACTLALPMWAYFLQLVRSGVLAELRSPHSTTARAAGVDGFALLARALRASTASTLQVAGLWLRVVLGGTVVVEFVFSWPGLGNITANAIQARDVPLVTATTLLGALAVVLGTLLADLGQAWLDPRSRHHLLGDPEHHDRSVMPS